jgi:hypothetical protein
MFHKYITNQHTGAKSLISQQFAQPHKKFQAFMEPRGLLPIKSLRRRGWNTFSVSSPHSETPVGVMSGEQS